MIELPVNPNSIYVSTVQTGCCKSEFDYTYPIQLNGIIGPEEYQESINKINRTISSRAATLFLTIIFISATIVAVACCLIGAEQQTRPGFPPLAAGGLAFGIFGTLVFGFGLRIINYRRTARMRDAIAEESMKYSARSTPCSWRLEISRIYLGGYGNNARVHYRIVIDIGRSTAPGSAAYYSNQVPNESSSLFISGQQNNYAPPPYSGQSTSFCSRCGEARQDLSARFCSSCGQAFNKY